MSTTTFFVAPTNDLSGDGSQRAPFGSMEQAKAAVRTLLAERQSEKIVVILSGGTYTIHETLIFGPEDTLEDKLDGTTSVTYRAQQGETPVLSAGCTIDGWRRWTDGDSPVPESAKKEIWVAELPKGMERFNALYDEHGILTRAHSEHLSMVKEEQEPTVPSVPAGADPETFLSELPVYRELKFHPGDMKAWDNVGDIELFMTPRVPWTVNFLGIESIDLERGVARTTLPATYPLTTEYGPAHIKRFYRIENLPELIDGPGKWAVNTQKNSVYVWPRTNSINGDAPSGITAPMLTELVRFEGDFEHSRWVKNITFEGITFTHSDRMVWRHGRRSLQHDWEQEDEPNAMLRLRGTEGITIRNCTFTRGGSSGIRLDLHAVDNVIDHNTISELGGLGISLVGYGPGTRDENHHNTVKGNHIHHIGQLWWHSAGIFIAQSGHNLIADNLIHNTPYCGMVVSGPRMGILKPDGFRLREGSLTIRRDELGDAPYEWPVMLGFLHARYNIIEHNEVYGTMEKLGDGNGIYVSGTGAGNVLRRNYVHDIEGKGAVAGIRLDDEEYYTLVSENIVWKVCAAGLITKNINQIENNIIVDCYGPHQYGHISVRHRGPCHGTGIRRNIMVRIAGREQNMPFLVYGDDGVEFLHHVSLDDNLLWDTGDPKAAESAIALAEQHGQGRRSVAADPRFIDIAHGDFRLSANSPALKIGFRPIDSWGPRGDVGSRQQASQPL